MSIEKVSAYRMIAPRPPLLLLLFGIWGIVSVHATAQHNSAAPIYTVEDARTLRFELTFEQPNGPGGLSGVRAPRGFDVASIPGSKLPAFSTELAVAASSISVEAVDVVELQGMEAEKMLARDVPFPQSSRSAARAEHVGSSAPLEWATVGRGGKIGGVELSNLTLHPYRHDPARRVVLWARRLVVRVTISGGDPRRAWDVAGQLAAARSEKAGRRGVLSEPARSTSVTAPDGLEYKIQTDSNGIYRVSASDLQRIGVPIDRIETRSLRLFLDAVEIPIQVEDRGNGRLEYDERVEEHFEFFGERPRARTVEPGSDLVSDPYATYSTYFLTWGGAAGKRMVDEGSDTRQRAAGEVHDLTSETVSFRSTVHLEENRRASISFNSNLNTLSDRFDRTIWEHIPASSQVTVSGVIPAPDPLSETPLRMTVALKGSSGKGESRAEMLKKHHTAEIFLSNRRALEVSFKGDTIAFASTDSNSAGTPTSAWLPPDGIGNISIINRFSAPNGTGSSISLNWIDITYQRLYRAYRDRIEFSVPQGLGMRYFRFRLRGFTSPDIRIYRNGISRIANVSIVPRSNASGDGVESYDAIFQVYVASPVEQFTAVTAPTLHRPIMSRDSTARLSEPNESDYIVIVDDISSDLGRLSEPSHPLRRFVLQKQSEGFRPRIVRAVDIYDEFSGGRVSPEAIRRYLRHAYTVGAVAPRYALIFGNGTPMTRDDLEHYYTSLDESIVPWLAERSYVPTINFQTIDFGATPCDYLLGCFAGEAPIVASPYEGARFEDAADFSPEVIVGRVNVLTPSDVARYVDKLIDQKRSADNGWWRITSEFIGGNDPAFFSQIDGLVDRHYRTASEPQRIYASPLYGGSSYGDVDRVVGVMRDPGAALVTYMGHGGGGQWEDAATLNSGNLHLMGNSGRMGTVLSYTCFSGAYSARSGLLSAMMIQPENGAISALGTAGLGWLLNNGLLAEAISSVIFNPRYRGLGFGEIVALGKARYVGINSRLFPEQVPSVAAMYSIFGDPSLEIPLVRDTVTLHPGATSVRPGGTMTASVDLPFTPTSVIVALFDSSEVAYSRRTIDAAALSRQISLDGVVPSSYRGSYTGIRIYAVGPRGEHVSGSVRFSTGEGSIVEVVPAGRFAAGSDAIFEVATTGPVEPDSVTLALDYHGSYVFTGRRLALKKIAEGRYRTDPLSGTSIEPGARVTLTVAMPKSIDGRTTFSFIAEGGPDPAAFRPGAADTARMRYAQRADYADEGMPTEAIRFVPTAGGARLSGRLYNWGDEAARDVAWSMSIDSLGTLVTLATGKVTIDARDSIMVEGAVGPSPPIERRIVLAVHPAPGDHRQDAFPRNNRAYNRIAPRAGLFREGSGFVDAGAGSGFDFSPVGRASLVATGGVREGIETASLLSTRPPSAQPWRFIDLGDSAVGGAALRLDVEPANASDARISLTLRADSSRGGAPDAARIVRYNSATKLWLAADTRVERGGREFTATVPAGGTYALAVSADSEGPEVRFSAEGIYFADSVVVPPNANISAVVFDPSGIDTDPERIHLRLDGAELALGSDYVILDSTITPTTMNLRLQRTLEVGRHTLELETYDRLGNRTIAQITFQVETDLALVVYGNFPNPFTIETFLAYEIRGSGGVDKVELVIFTTAGRAIRTIAYPASQPSDQDPLIKGGTGIPTAPGYHEAWWDGRDQNGAEVANGAYFYRLRITSEEEELEQLGTIVRVR